MYDLEEQEKIDALKAWWHANRRALLLAALAGVLAFGGVTGWKAWKRAQAEKAAAAFQQYEQSVRAAGTDALKIRAAAALIEGQAPDSPYAARAALAAAQVLAGAGKSSEAQLELQWVIAHAREPQVLAIARVRLAGVLADAQQYSQALALLDGGLDDGFKALAEDRRGDILLASGKTDEARAAYARALAAAEPNNPLRQTLSTKLSALGGDPGAKP